jgi:hypothetical protein
VHTEIILLEACVEVSTVHGEGHSDELLLCLFLDGLHRCLLYVHRCATCYKCVRRPVLVDKVWWYSFLCGKMACKVCDGDVTTM